MQPATASMRLAYLDSLRCIAALAVVAQHLLETIDPTRFAGVLDCAPGVFGVVLFFYLSGFVLPLSVQKSPAPAVFFLRRVMRIYPAYLVTLCIVVAPALVRRHELPAPGLGVLGVLANLLFLQDIVHVPALLGVTWTLCLEFAWYFAFALIFFRRRRPSTALLLIGFGAGLLLISAVSLWSDMRVPAGRLGLLGAALLGYATWQRQNSELSASAYLVGAATFLGSLTFALYVAFGVYHHPHIQLHHSFVPWLCATTLFLCSTLVQRPLLRRVLSWPVAVFLGKVSYSLYLLHCLCIWSVRSYFDATQTLYLAPVVSVIAAWLLYRFVELPGIKLGRLIEQALAARGSVLARASVVGRYPENHVR